MESMFYDRVYVMILSENRKYDKKGQQSWSEK